MAAPGDSKTALASQGFRRLWTALGKPDGDAGRLDADVVPLDRDAPASPADEPRTFRLLESGTKDLRSREEVASGPASMSGGGAASTLRAVVRPFAGSVAAIVATAAAMTFLFPPGKADAYHYRSDGGHFDHAQKELIRLIPTYKLMADRVDAWKKFQSSASAWSGSSNVKITPDPGGNPMSTLALTATYVDVPGANYSGWAQMSSVDSRSHWTGKPAGTVALNVGVTDAQTNWVDRKLLAHAVISHELGHALGLAHTGINGCNGSKWNQGIMQDTDTQFYYECGFTSPQEDDTNGVNQLYLASSK